MNPSERMKEIRTKHPFPWKEMVHRSGLVQMIDANGNEVGIFEITNLTAIVTAALVKEKG